MCLRNGAMTSGSGVKGGAYPWSGRGPRGPGGTGVYGGVCTPLSEHGPRKGWDPREDTGLMGAHRRGRLCPGEDIHNPVGKCGGSLKGMVWGEWL